MTLKRLVFFGSGPLATELLTEALGLPDITIVSVVTAPLPTIGHRSQQSSPLVDLAEAHNIPVLRPTKILEALQSLQDLKADAGLLLAYGKILPQPILECFPQGIINIHPSLLPLHRGPSPIEATLLAGDTVAGVSIMLIDQQMDSGPILSQGSFAISQRITKPELTGQLINLARQLTRDSLMPYLTGDLQPSDQPDTPQATYCKLIKKTDGDMRLDETSAIELDRAVRAYAGWPGVRIPVVYKGQPTTLSLHAVEPIAVSDLTTTFELIDGELIAQTSAGAIKLISVQLPSKPRISGRDLWNGGQLSSAIN